jgi:NTP pyrophosphatase (non-canonical NTP hydrolase)
MDAKLEYNEGGGLLMNDCNTTLQDIKDTIGQFTAARDWQQFHCPKNVAMALVTEASELMAHFRWTALGDMCALDDPQSLVEIRHEVADVLLLLAEFANVAGIDLATAVREKMEINAQRYSVEKSRGTARKYRRLAEE